MDQCSDILKLCGDRLIMLSGDDPLTLPLMAMGAKGVISPVATNVMPREMHQLTAAALWATPQPRARTALQNAATDAGAVHGNQPDSDQAGVRVHGNVRNEMRMPLLPMSQRPAEKLRAVMKELRLI